MGPDQRRFIVEILLRARDEMTRVFQQAAKSIEDVSQAQQKAAGERAKATGVDRASADALSKLIEAHTREKKALDESAASLRKEATARREVANDARKAFEELQKQARLNRAISAEREKQQIEEITRLRREVAERNAADVKKTRAYQKETKALSDRAKVLAAQAAEESALNKRRAAELDLEIAKRQQATRELDRTATAAEKSAKATEQQVTVLGRELDKLSREFEKVSRSSQEAEDSGRGFRAFLQRIRGDAKDADIDLARLAATFRGFQIAFVIKYAQALISAFTALAATLFSVAASAVQAGTALVAGFAAGAAQALPIAGALIATLTRVAAVVKAVNLQQQLSLTAQRDQEQSQERQRAATERLQSAQESANEAQRQRNQVLREARAEVEALADAELGATLSVEQAQSRLRQAILEGGATDVAEAQLAVSEARRRQGTVRADVRSVQRTGFTRSGAERVAAADRNAARAAREVANARRDAAQATEEQTAATDRLTEMLEQLSPAERGLYRAILRIRGTVEQRVRPITDIIIRAFTRGLDRANVLLQRPQVLRAFDRVARSIARSFDELVRAGTRQERVDFLTFLSQQITRNGPIVTRILITMLRIFENIARAGAPAFREILTLIDRFLGRIEIATSRTGRLSDFFLEGVGHLEAWATLLENVILLFAALAGAGGAESGLRAIEAANRWLEDMTERIRDNRTEIGRFFEDSRLAVGQLLRVIGALALAIGQIFSTTNVKTFSDFLITVVIPALTSVIQIMGALTSAVHALLSLPVVSELAAWLATLIALSKGLSILRGAVTALGLALGFVRKEGRLLFVGNPWLLAIGAIASALTLLNEKFGIFKAFGNLFESSSDRARAAQERLTNSIEKSIAALRRQRDQELARRNAQLALERAELGVLHARQEIDRVNKAIESGEIKGKDADIARREARLGLKQAILDEKSARVLARDERKKEREEDRKTIAQNLEVIEGVEKRVATLKEEREDIKENVRFARNNLEAEKERLRTLTPGTDAYRVATENLKARQDQLREAQGKLRDNTDALRQAAKDGAAEFRRWRTAVRRAGGSTETFEATVHNAMAGVVEDVNQVLTEFGARPLRFNVRRRRTTSTSRLEGASDIFGAPDIGGFPGRQSGGWLVPGYGSGDSVHMQAMVEPGEEIFVLNRNAAQFRRWLEQLNMGVPRFQRGGIVPIPGQPGESIDRRILRDVLAITRRYKARVTDGYAPSGHAAAGEHPLGLAVDLVPGPGGSWDLIDKLAAWAEPRQNQPRYPFRWVGYTGDAGHGTGDHLHLSWLHEGIRAVQTLRGRIGAVLDQVREREVTGPAGALRRMLRGYERRLRRSGNRYIERALSQLGVVSQGDPGERVTGSGAGLMRRISSQRGWNFADWWALDARETSHGRNLVNPSSSARLRGQFLDFNWGKYGPGSDPRQNPTMAQQIRSMASYIAERYGSPTAALAHHLANNWYQRGGLVRMPRLQRGGWMPRLQGGTPPNVNVGAGDTRQQLGSGWRRTLGRIMEIFEGLSDGRAENIAQRVRRAFQRVFDEGGLLARISAAIERISAEGARRAQRAQFRLRDGRPVRGAGEQRVAEIELETLQQQRRPLEAEREALAEGLRAARAALQRAPDRQARQQIRGEINRIRKLQEELTQILVDNTQAQVEAQERVQQALLESITSRAERREAAIDRAQRLATALGQELDPATVIDQRVTVMQDQITGLRRVLRRAERTGNRELARQVRGQIAELETSIAEAAAQRFQASIDAVNQRAARGLGAQERRLRLAEIGGTNFGLRGSALVAQGQILQEQRAGLAALFGQAALAGNITQMQSLEDQIAELDVTIAENAEAVKDNTRAANQARIDRITGRQGFLSGVGGGAVGVLQAIGQLTGTTDTGAIAGILASLGTSLAGTRVSLAEELFRIFGVDVRGLSGADLVRAITSLNLDTITTNLSEDDRSQFENLVNALISNEQAIVDNTQAVQEATGQTMTQDFTTTAWQLFREAIFTGSGALLPRYAELIPRAQYGGHVMSEGVAYLHPNEDVVPAGNRGDVFAPTIHVTEQVEEAHPEVILNRLFFRYRNRPKAS